MRYVRIYATADGGSKFEDVEIEVEARHVVEGVPPLMLFRPFPVSALIFVELPKEPVGFQPDVAHVAPRRQWVIPLSGRAEVIASNGDRRQLGPGDAVLVEDTVGKGHVTTPLTLDFRFVMIPVA
jgi:hypothetical protein